MPTAALKVHARMSWALVAMGFTLFMGALLWGLLNPHVLDMLSYSTSMSSSAHADEGARRVGMVWKYWPLWFGAALMLYGYRRAVNESKRGGF